MRLFLLSLASILTLVLPTAAQQAPNIVWLVAEDMSPWIPCYGDDTVATPNLDRLAAEGLCYENAFASSPVCAAARSSLITGMFATRIGTMHHRTGNPSKTAVEADPEAYADIPSYEGVPPDFVRCFPEHLRRAGYYCTNAAKTDYQFKPPVTVWDESSGKAHWRNRAEGQPFFAVFNYGGTHESQAFPESKRRPAVVDPEVLTLPPFYPDTPAVRDAMARTYNNIAALDDWVGARMKELEEAELLDDTIVFFYTDHGVGLPRGKRSVYDTGTRVPLLVRFPGGRGAATRIERVVTFVDFGPTVLSLAGVEPDARLDGIPFLGEFARPGSGFAFVHADRFDAVREQTRSVSDGRFRYVRNYRTDVPYLIPVAYRERIPMTADLYALRDEQRGTPDQWQMRATERPLEELYDSENDPWEVENLAGRPEHLARLVELRAALNAWIEDTGDLGFVLPESVLVRDHLWSPTRRGVQGNPFWPQDPDSTTGSTPQPTTTDPSTSIQEVRGRVVLEVYCQTTGASIGIRWYHTGEKPPKSWEIYTGPTELPPTPVTVEINAHRIGYKPARVTREFGER